MRADRLLQLVGLLRAHERMSAAELARRLEVSPRTVMRDIEALSAAGVPVYAERGRSGGYALLPGYRPDVEELTPGEARALFVAGGPAVAEALGLSGEHEAGLRKLATGLPSHETGRIGRALDRLVVDPGGWSGVRHQPALLRTLAGAVEADRRVRGSYRAASSRWGGRRTLDPWGLVLAGNSWYLVAAHRGRPHTYRVDRFETLEVLDEPCRRPPSVDLLATWREIRDRWQGRPAVRVVLRVRSDQADLARRQLAMVLRGPVESAPDGPEHQRLTAPVGSLRGLAGVLAGFGSWVEVLEPPVAREMMRRVAQETLAAHAGSESGTDQPDTEQCDTDRHGTDQHDTHEPTSGRASGATTASVESPGT
ncbi:YafY family protein [Janibacter alkaliphilus]|uniref:Putative DNA-binding transcriptional regulator YafY n=1 Tax=Janibacter alkaliphilus TaxID=1069963 RepID=A0A852X4K3_9MICO|nr:putative DNA-binding transcriptional regulator YafY [Janibacter alkaliphilus]